MAESHNPDHSSVVYALVDWQNQNLPVSIAEANVLASAAVEVDSYVGKHYSEIREMVVYTALKSLIKGRRLAQQSTLAPETVYVATCTDINTGKPIFAGRMEYSA